MCSSPARFAACGALLPATGQCEAPCRDVIEYALASFRSPQGVVVQIVEFTSPNRSFFLMAGGVAVRPSPLSAERGKINLKQITSMKDGVILSPSPRVR